jgi:hypothetical protein
VVRTNALIHHAPRGLPIEAIRPPCAAAGYCERVTEESKSKLLPFPLMDSGERDLRMAAVQTRFEAAKRLVGYEAAQSMSPPRLDLRDGPDGGENVVVEWSAPEAVMRRWRLLAAAEQPEGEAQGEAQGDADGGEGGVLAAGNSGEGGQAVDGVVGEANGGEGGELAAAAAAERPWAPKDTDELFSEIATMDYGVSDDRSSKLATPAIKAYNKVAGTYEQAWQKRGQPLLEGFTIVKVRCMHRLRPC